MTGNATPPPAAPGEAEPELEWIEDLEHDLRRAADRPEPPRQRGLLSRLLDGRD